MYGHPAAHPSSTPVARILTMIATALLMLVALAAPPAAADEPARTASPQRSHDLVGSLPTTALRTVPPGSDRHPSVAPTAVSTGDDSTGPVLVTLTEPPLLRRAHVVGALAPAPGTAAGSGPAAAPRDRAPPAAHR